MKTRKRVCAKLGAERATPHDLRRTHGTTITGLGLGREAMNRFQNHKEGGIGDVYDQHDYSAEIKHTMEMAAARIMALVEGRPGAGNVVTLGRQIPLDFGVLSYKGARHSRFARLVHPSGR